METVDVRTDKGYNVYIGRGLLDSVGELALEHVRPCKAAVITDDTVDALYYKRLESSLDSAGYEPIRYVFPHGEASKNAATYIDILEFCAREHLCRSDAIFALGGGVVGDLAGFAAATYMRGISFVQIPTTLLAAVDSSVGGKTAIDLGAGKNLAGAFYQPSLVVCDPQLLETLDETVFCDGCAEILKYGAISDAHIFEMMRSRKDMDIEAVIKRSVEIKRDVVSEDERESGIRQILNFGHTFGHAVEACSGYRITHGSAVAIGMSIMLRGSAVRGICSREYANKVIELIHGYSLPSVTEYDADELFEAVLSDKKRKSDRITLVLPREAGKCELYSAPLEEARELLKAGL